MIMLIGALLFSAGAGLGLIWRQQRLRFYRERVEAADALRESEKQYRELFESATDALLLIAADSSRIIDANDMASVLYGYARDELLAKNSTDLSAEPEETRRRLQEAQSKPGQSFHVLQRLHRKKNGDVFSVEITARTLFRSGQTVLLVASRDITERKRAKEYAARLHQQNELILSSAAEGILGLDLQGHHTFVNPAAAKMLGYSTEELIGHASHSIWHHTRADGSPYLSEACQIQAACRDGTRHQVSDEVFWRKDGTSFPVKYASTPILEEERLVGAVVTFSDITEQKRMAAKQEQLLAKNLQLQKSESLGRMAGAIAHTFNNLLAAVTLNLELLQQELPAHAGVGVNLSEALQSARKAAAISSQMLVYLGQSLVQREPLDLSEACRLGLPLLQAALPNGMVLETDLPAPGPVIQANASQMQQVLTQILTNAREASREGSGAIRLTVKQVSAAAIPTVNRFPIDWQPGDPAYACLEISDIGCGIAAKDMDKLFDPFFTNKFIGRGLGLAVVLGIAREHGGGVMVESELGRGSTFRVFLPVTAAVVRPKPVPVVAAPTTAEKATVLVIEDEPALRTAVTHALQQRGLKVFAAVDGVEGVELFEQHRDKIQCVLCDLTMPRMDGWETLTTLRQLAPGIPFILSSGYNDARVMEGRHPELPQAFLQKPYKLNALVSLINQVRPEVRPEKGS